MQTLFTQDVSGCINYLPGIPSGKRYQMSAAYNIYGLRISMASELTGILNYMAICLKLLHGNLRTFGEKENIPVLVPHRDRCYIGVSLRD